MSIEAVYIPIIGTDRYRRLAGSGAETTTMNGSEKQIAYARQVQAAALKIIANEIASAARNQDGSDDEIDWRAGIEVGYLRAVDCAFRNCTEARVIIDAARGSYRLQPEQLVDYLVRAGRLDDAQRMDRSPGGYGVRSSQKAVANGVPSPFADFVVRWGV